MSLSAMLEQGAGTTGEQIQRILRAVRTHLGMDVGFVSEFVADKRVIRYLDGDLGRRPLAVGSSDPLERSFCHYVARGLMPEMLRDAADHEIAGRLPPTRDVPIGAHLSVPLRHADGEAYGTICCFSFAPDRSLTSRDLATLRLCAEVVAAAIEKDHAAQREAASRHARVRSVIEREALEPVYQPVYRTSDGQLMAFEALSRIAAEPLRPPTAWFADAAEVGLGDELEALALRKALAALPELGPALKLMVNLSPSHMTAPRVVALLREAPLRRLVLEITENVAVDDYGALQAALAPLRAAGLRLAIDDVGAGHSSFRHVLDLSPEFIKLDMTLTRAIDRDSSRRALAAALTNYSRQMGCEVVAEGVETAAEFACLRDIGVTRVQGFLMGRPRPLAEIGSVAPRYVEPGEGEAPGPGARSS